MKKVRTPNKRLREVRLANCWTMAVAAERTNVSFEAYQRWEYGLQEPRLDSLKMLCDAFGKSPDELGFGHLVKTPQQEPEEEKQFTEPTPSSAPQMMILTPEQAKPRHDSMDTYLSQFIGLKMRQEYRCSSLKSTLNGLNELFLV